MLAILATVGYVGHRHHWQWDEKAEAKGTEKKEADNDEPTAVDEGSLGYSSFDPAMPLTHSPANCKYDKKDITFKDAEALQRAGIFTGKVGKQTIDDVLTVTASVDHDPTRVARLAVHERYYLCIDKEGDDVKPNELLAIVESGEVGKAKSAFFQAKVQVDLKEQVRSRLQAGISSDRVILEADAAMREARLQLQTAYQSLINLGLKISIADAEKASDTELLQRLQFLGLEKELGSAMQGEATNNLIAIRNPLMADKSDVLQREGVAGEAVAAGQMIFTVGDCRQMLLSLDIRQEDQQRVKRDQIVRFRADGLKGEPIVTKIDRISHDLDPKTRVLKARAFVNNLNHQLKAHVFGTAEIVLCAETSVLTIPEEAIQWEGCSHIVFILEKKEGKKEDNKEIVFETRRVKLGARREGYVEVTEGLKEGDTIAILGSHVLKSVLFKDRLGSADE